MAITQPAKGCGAGGGDGAAWAAAALLRGAMLDVDVGKGKLGS